MGKINMHINAYLKYIHIDRISTYMCMYIKFIFIHTYIFNFFLTHLCIHIQICLCVCLFIKVKILQENPL